MIPLAAVAVGWLVGRTVRALAPAARTVAPYVVDLIKLRAALAAHNAAAAADRKDRSDG